MFRTMTVITLAATTALGAQRAPMTLAPTSTLRVEGSSNVHDWHAKTSSLTATIEVAAPIGAGAKVEAVTLTVPVRSLKSGKDGLDKNMYKAMNADAHPTISYRMTRYASELGDGGYVATVTGLLTVKGVEKEVIATATMRGDAHGLTASGSTTFRMTDFGIKPVTALLGTIRTKDEITIRFELTGAAATGVAGLPNR